MVSMISCINVDRFVWSVVVTECMSVVVRQRLEKGVVVGVVVGVVGVGVVVGVVVTKQWRRVPTFSNVASGMVSRV